jgi:hypothetical protein
MLPAIKDQILSDLGRLAPEQQRRAAELVHGLVSPLPRGASGRDLLRFSGTVDDESAREMMEVVEEARPFQAPPSWSCGGLPPRRRGPLRQVASCRLLPLNRFLI